MRGLYLALPLAALLLAGGTTFAAAPTDTTMGTTPSTTAPATTAPTATHHRSHRSHQAATETPSTNAPATTGQAATGTAPATNTHHGTASTASVTKYPSESQAAQACGASNVVWANTSTKALHAPGDQYFGHTKHGAFMCKSTATAAGFHMSGQKG